jgi:hypothetical protein
MSSTITYSQTFTITNARYLASKVKTDLKRIQQFYGKPSDRWIDDYENEMVAFLVNGLLGKVDYGFQRHGVFISPTLEYTAQELAANLQNDRPGNIATGQDISGSDFTSFLSYSNKWSNMTEAERAAFKADLPFQRGTGNTPSVSGYYQDDKNYTSGGTSLARKSLMGW